MVIPTSLQGHCCLGLAIAEWGRACIFFNAQKLTDSLCLKTTTFKKKKKHKETQLFVACFRGCQKRELFLVTHKLQYIAYHFQQQSKLSITWKMNTGLFSLSESLHCKSVLRQGVEILLSERFKIRASKRLERDKSLWHKERTG